MKLTMIAAIGKNRELGKDNDLIWHFPSDLKFFKEQTKGHMMVMGRKTFDSLPGMLPNRKHIVISRSQPDLPKEVEIFKNIDEFIESYKTSDDEIFVIGGASIYAQFLEKADRLLLTEIEQSYDADVYFPQFDPNLYIRKELGSVHEKDTDYTFVEYIKRT